MSKTNNLSLAEELALNTAAVNRHSELLEKQNGFLEKIANEEATTSKSSKPSSPSKPSSSKSTTSKPETKQTETEKPEGFATLKSAMLAYQRKFGEAKAKELIKGMTDANGEQIKKLSEISDVDAEELLDKINKMNEEEPF